MWQIAVQAASSSSSTSAASASKEYSPYLHHNHPDRVLWGDTHVHTSYSTDAGLIGSSDSHTSLATTREENSFGKASPVEPGTGEARYMQKITGIIPSRDGSDATLVHQERAYTSPIWYTP